MAINIGSLLKNLFKNGLINITVEKGAVNLEKLININEGQKVEKHITQVELKALNTPAQIIDGQKLEIDPEKLPSNIQQQLKAIIAEPPESSQIVEAKTYSLEDELGEVLESESDLINFFSNKIPAIYLDMLKVATVVKKKAENHENVSALKSQLANRYGQVANTICNLYSAGYFTEFLKPLYEEMSKNPNFTPSEYINKFIALVNDFPLAEFINHWMSTEEVENKIKNRVASNIRNGINKFKVHGIGHKNVQKIREVVDKLEKKGKIEIRDLTKEGETIIVEILIPQAK